MSRAFEILSQAIGEVIEDTKKGKDGTLIKRRRSSIKVAPVQKFTAQNIKFIREKNGLTQKSMAAYMGVSIKTVEAWESGKNEPNGPSSRLLELIDKGEVKIAAM
jgi:putative transcriptional regulator